MKRDGWIQVEREDELRAGALVEIRPCAFCGKTERMILLRPVVTTSGASLTEAGDFAAAGACWSVAPGLCVNPGRPFDPSAAIATGRLWRRAETQEQRKRQREDVIAGKGVALKNGRT